MLNTLIQMSALIVAGALWRVLSPGKSSADQLRLALADLVYYLLLPALVLQVLWQAPIGIDSLRLSLVALSGTIITMLLSWLVCRSCQMERAVTGAVILAASFANVTYMGLAVMESVFGTWARSVAIQYDLFANTPLLFTVGVILAQRFGQAATEKQQILKSLLRIPPLWAALVAVVLNLFAVPMPAQLDAILSLLGSGVILLMLLALGMSLRWETLQISRLPPVTVIVVFQLLLMPMIVAFLSTMAGLSGEFRTAVIIEAAMPSMVLGIMLCDRYGLNTAVYAAGVTMSTAVSLITLPLWYEWLT